MFTSEVFDHQDIADDIKILKEMLKDEKKEGKESAEPVDESLEGVFEIIDTKPELRDAVTYVPPDVDQGNAAIIMRIQDIATTYVDQSLILLVEDKDETAFAQTLRLARQKLRLDPAVTDGPYRTYNFGYYDIKLSGETVTHPHLRVMQFRAEHYSKTVRAFFRSLLPK